MSAQNTQRLALGRFGWNAPMRETDFMWPCLLVAGCLLLKQASGVRFSIGLPSLNGAPKENSTGFLFRYAKIARLVACNQTVQFNFSAAVCYG